MEVLIGLGSACLLIRVGLSLYRCGLIRAKNAAGTFLGTLADLCVSLIAFWAFGAAFFFHRHRAYLFFDWHWFAFQTGTSEMFFLMAVVLIGTGIVGGAVAERSRFFPLWCASVLLAGFLIPVGANWAWSGWLHRLGFIDAGGGSWLHLSGAACAAVAAWIIGPRTGKYHHDGSASMIPGHNVPLAGFGVLAILVGWAPYLAGCLLMNEGAGLIGTAATSTLLAGASAGMAAMLLGNFRYGKPDVIITLLGFLGGLVAISAGAGRINAQWALLVGAVAGVLVPMSAIWIDLIGRIDDPAGVIAVHGVGAVWGLFATGLLVPGSPGQRLHQTGTQILGLACVALLSLLSSAILFSILQATVRLRAGEADEFEGLDLAEHDIGAYPDFQQNTIKSYHLREA